MTPSGIVLDRKESTWNGLLTEKRILYFSLSFCHLAARMEASERTLNSERLGSKLGNQKS